MWKFQAWNFQVWNFSTLQIWHNFNLICMLKFSRDHMWKFQGWNRCDSHVRVGVIDLVRVLTCIYSQYTIMYLLLINVFLGNSAILFYQINDVVMQMFCFLYTGWFLKTLCSSGNQLYKLDEFLGTAPPSIFVCVVFFNVLEYWDITRQAKRTISCTKH